MEQTNSCDISEPCNIVARDSAANIPFHRHCQKTICSAYGYSGNGATWSTINTLELPNINGVLLTSTSWKDYFTGNENNITEDLASILKLIDRVAGKSFQFNIKFVDANENAILATKSGSTYIDTQAFHPGVETNINHVFKLGRVVEINFEFGSRFNWESSYTAKFNTMQADSANDRLSVQIPAKTLTFRFNGTTLETIRNVVMPDDVDIDMGYDYNEIPACQCSRSSNQLMIYKYIHVYRIYNEGANSLRNINLSAYNSSAQPIIGFEIHVQSNSAVTLQAPSVTGVSSSSSPSIVGLTDKLTVDARKTNVYVFRWDRIRKVLTYSLAYQY